MKIGKKEVVLLLMAAAVLFASVGCSKKDSSASAEAAEVRDTLYIQISADPGDLNPYTTNTTQSARVNKQVYEPLMDLGYDMKLTPILAESWEREDDTHYIFHIRKGVKFHNGEDLTSEDVVFSINTAYSIKLSRKYVENVDVEGTEAIDDYTVRVALTKPDLFFLTGVTSLRIVNKEAYEADPDHFANHPQGTGPYVFEDWRLGSSITLKKNNEYWGTPASIETLVYRPIGEAAQRAIELETGGVDIVLDLQASDYKRLEGDENFEVFKKVGFRSKSLYFNNTNASVMSDKTLRQALSYAIDTNAIAKVAYNGFARPAVTFFTEGFVNYDERFNKGIFYAQDFEKAKSLLAEAGYPDGLEINFFISDLNIDVLCAEIIQNQLSQIGVKAVIKSFEAAVYNPTIGDTNSGWDIAITALQCPSGHSMDYFNAFLAADGLNRPKYQSDEFNVLIKEAVVTTDEVKARELEDRIMALLTEDVPFRPLVQEEQLYAWNKELKNFKVWGQNNVHLVDVSF